MDAPAWIALAMTVCLVASCAAIFRIAGLLARQTRLLDSIATTLRRARAASGGHGEVDPEELRLKR